MIEEMMERILDWQVWLGAFVSFIIPFSMNRLFTYLKDKM